jgi:hypothetical protein
MNALQLIATIGLASLPLFGSPMATTVSSTTPSMAHRQGPSLLDEVLARSPWVPTARKSITARSFTGAAAGNDQRASVASRSQAVPHLLFVS